MPVILAHGAMGQYYEVALVGTFIVFTLLLIYGWFKSRSYKPVLEDEEFEES